MNRLVLSLALALAACDRPVATGGEIVEKACFTVPEGGGRCRLGIDYRGCTVEGVCVVSRQHLRPQTFAKVRVGDHFGENPPRLVASDLDRKLNRDLSRAWWVARQLILLALGFAVGKVLLVFGKRHLHAVRFLRALRRTRPAHTAPTLGVHR